MTVVSRTSDFAQRFPTVETVTVEWEERLRQAEGKAAARGPFSHSIPTKGGGFEPVLPCPNPRCRGGGFEVEEVMESMISDRQEVKAGLLVCIGWEQAKAKPAEPSPCTHAISYRIRLTYRKTSPSRSHPPRQSRKQG